VVVLSAKRRFSRRSQKSSEAAHMAWRFIAALALAWAVAVPAGAEEVRIGYSLSVDLPWVTMKESKVQSGPSVSRAQTFIATFWSEKYGRILGVLAVVPRPMTYFTGENLPLEKEITNWTFFEDKTISDQRGVACVYGNCLAFKAGDLGCAVFRRQIGTAGKARVESYSETAGPRLHGFYCSYATPAIDARELDAVLQGIKS
jgi:hypothetical protein